MKKFKYNGVEYTLYGRGENQNSRHPCIVDESGNCPYHSQRGIVRALLNANNVWPKASENTHQYIARARQLPETAVSDIHGAVQVDDDAQRFKKLLEWFVRQQKINGDIIQGEHVAGYGYKGQKIREYYADWRDYGDFTLDITLRCDFLLGTKANYIHVTDARVNIIADYTHPDPKKCDVTALKICVNANASDERTFSSVSVHALGLFDGQAPNPTLKKFFRDYVNEIYLARDGEENPAENTQEEKPMNYPLNQILYGPPGTGKTYNTICYALAIVNDRPVEEIRQRMKQDKEEVLEEYRRFLHSGWISFTTFHQSMGYEEFIEGIKPETDDGGDVKYAVKPGIFKKFCDKAKILRSSLTDSNYFFSGSPTVWKVSLAGTGNNPVRQECFEHNHIRIGWDEYGEEVTEDTEYRSGGKYILDAFINTMRRGDIVLSCYSADYIDAIGVVTGDYEWHKEYDHYKRVRPVQWIVKNVKEYIVSANGGKRLTLSTVYKLNISVEDIVAMIDRNSDGDSEAHYEYPDRYVFIVDEINRGNVSKIFGELITLIEDSKRLGNAEETQCILPYSGEKFGVPKNVYLLGTMNTADRSLVQLDAALRRRFSFIEMMPDPDILPALQIDGVDLKRMLTAINERICALVDREHQIGHAYFMGLTSNSTVKDLADIFREKILPLLQEYFYDDYTAIREVLSDAFITEKIVNLRHGDSKTVYEIAIPEEAEAYRSIYDVS